MNNKSKVLSNSVLYTISNLLLKGLNFFLLPIFTYSMSSAEYGVINLINGFKYIMSFIIAFSLYSAVTRFYADYKNKRHDLKIYNGTLIMFMLASGVFFLILSTFVQNFLTDVFFDGIPYFPIIFITMLFLIFFTQHTLHQNILKAMQKGGKLTLTNILFAVFQTILIIIFVGLLKWGAFGYVLCLLIINVIYFIFMIVDLKFNNLLTFRFDTKQLKESLKYSIPLMPHDLSGQISSFFSKVLINHSGSLSSVGLYSVASQFGVLVDSFQFSVNKAFAPWFFNYMNETQSEEKTDANELSTLLLYIYSVVYLLIGLFSQEVIMFITPESYTNAWKIIPIIVIGYAIKSIYYFLLNVLMYFKTASRRIFIATLGGSLFEIFLASFLIPIYGMYGAALSFTISKIIMVLLMIYISRGYEKVFNVRKMIRIIFPSIISIFIGLIFSYIKFDNIFNIYNLFYKILIFICYCIYIYFNNKNIIDEYKKPLLNKIQNKYDQKI